MSQEGDKKVSIPQQGGEMYNQPAPKKKRAPKLKELEQLCDSHGKKQLSTMAEEPSILHLYESLIY